MADWIRPRRRERMVRAAIGLAAAAIAVAGGLWWWRIETASPIGRIDPGDPAQVELGREVYTRQCAGCHGDKLQGQSDWRIRRADGRLPAPPHDETGHTWHHSDELLFGMTKYGLSPYAPPGYESDMPAFQGTLTDEQIRAVLAFIKSTWPERIRRLQEEANRQAQP